MYKYYQIGPNSTWELIEDSPDIEELATNLGAKRLTILSVDQPVDANTIRDEQKQSGDMYFDIDSHDLLLAIYATQDLVRKLRDLGVPDSHVWVYASGSKGFHVIVKASIFSSGRAVKNLVSIYKEMALELYVPGMDFQVYSGGKGVVWRLTNVQRDDGKYRVFITVDELFDMTVDWYRQLVSGPRTVKPQLVDDSFKSTAMEALFERCKKRARARPAQPAPVPDERLADYRDEPPPCIHEVVDYKVKPSRNFNEVALQFGIFIARSGINNVLEQSLVSRLAANGNSHSYSTPRAREDHLKGLVGYLKVTPNKQFSCNAMRSVMSNRPCADCDLCRQGEQNAEPGEDIGLFARSDGYYVAGANDDRRISTFILRATDVFLEASQSGKTVRRVGATVEIMRDGEILGDVHFLETGWGSKSNFKHELKGIANLAFYGTEDDIQRIKHITLDEVHDMGEIVQVRSAGVHLHKIGGRDVKVYVEPGFSINQYRVRDTHTMTERVPAAPNIRVAALPDDADEKVSEALLHMLRVNSPYVLSQILGWTAACHLKMHFMKRYSQFPILSLWGNAGSAKTSTSTLYAWLNGCNYSMEDSSVSMASITPWAMIRLCSSTTTVPRLLEEYNKSKITHSKYDQIGEIMKMAWNGQVIARGGLKQSNVDGGGRGATVTETPISSPLVILSEQAPQMPALQQRSVQVKLDKEDFRGKETEFFLAVSQEEQLRRTARALVFSALSTDIPWIENEMEKANAALPGVLTDRPRFSYQVLLVGLSFFKKVCATFNLSQELLEEIDMLRDELLANMDERAETIAQKKMKTEVDMVMNDIGIMAQMTINDTRTWLSQGTHYVIRGRRIYFDLPVMFTTYRIFKTTCRERLVIDDEDQFKELISQEPYFITDRSVDGAKALGIQRAVLELDLDEMAEKGLDPEMYG